MASLTSRGREPATRGQYIDYRLAADNLGAITQTTLPMQENSKYQQPRDNMNILERYNNRTMEGHTDVFTAEVLNERANVTLSICAPLMYMSEHHVTFTTREYYMLPYDMAAIGGVPRRTFHEKGERTVSMHHYVRYQSMELNYLLDLKFGQEMLEETLGLIIAQARLTLSFQFSWGIVVCALEQSFESFRGSSRSALFMHNQTSYFAIANADVNDFNLKLVQLRDPQHEFDGLLVAQGQGPHLNEVAKERRSLDGFHYDYDAGTERLLLASYVAMEGVASIPMANGGYMAIIENVALHYSNTGPERMRPTQTLQGFATLCEVVLQPTINPDDDFSEGLHNPSLYDPVSYDQTETNIEHNPFVVTEALSHCGFWNNRDGSNPKPDVTSGAINPAGFGNIYLDVIEEISAASVQNAWLHNSHYGNDTPTSKDWDATSLKAMPFRQFSFATLVKDGDGPVKVAPAKYILSLPRLAFPDAYARRVVRGLYKAWVKDYGGVNLKGFMEMVFPDHDAAKAKGASRLMDDEVDEFPDGDSRDEEDVFLSTGDIERLGGKLEEMDKVFRPVLAAILHNVDFLAKFSGKEYAEVTKVAGTLRSMSDAYGFTPKKSQANKRAFVVDVIEVFQRLVRALSALSEKLHAISTVLKEDSESRESIMNATPKKEATRKILSLLEAELKDGAGAGTAVLPTTAKVRDAVVNLVKKVVGTYAKFLDVATKINAHVELKELVPTLEELIPLIEAHKKYEKDEKDWTPLSFETSTAALDHLARIIKRCDALVIEANTVVVTDDWLEDDKKLWKSLFDNFPTESGGLILQIQNLGDEIEEAAAKGMTFGSFGIHVPNSHATRFAAAYRSIAKETMKSSGSSQRSAAVARGTDAILNALRQTSGKEGSRLVIDDMATHLERGGSVADFGNGNVSLLTMRAKSRERPLSDSEMSQAIRARQLAEAPDAMDIDGDNSYSQKPSYRTRGRATFGRFGGADELPEDDNEEKKYPILIQRLKAISFGNTDMDDIYHYLGRAYFSYQNVYNLHKNFGLQLFRLNFWRPWQRYRMYHMIAMVRGPRTMVTGFASPIVHPAFQGMEGYINIVGQFFSALIVAQPNLVKLIPNVMTAGLLADINTEFVRSALECVSENVHKPSTIPEPVPLDETRYQWPLHMMNEDGAHIDDPMALSPYGRHSGAPIIAHTVGHEYLENMWAASIEGDPMTSLPMSLVGHRSWVMHMDKRLGRYNIIPGASPRGQSYHNAVEAAKVWAGAAVRFPRVPTFTKPVAS